MAASSRTAKPKLAHALRLRCPRCGETPLREDGSWFRFLSGCPRCDYRYDREPGYFWGAAWIISYTGASLAALALGAALLVYYPDLDSLVTALIAVLPVIPVALILHPYSRALWMWFDHTFHQLEDHEHLS